MNSGYSGGYSLPSHTDLGINERAIERNLQAFGIMGGRPMSSREQYQRGITQVGIMGGRPMSSREQYQRGITQANNQVTGSYYSLSSHREQNEPTTVQATYEGPLEWNIEALHFIRGLPTGNRQQSDRSTVSVDGQIAQEPTYNSFPPLVIPSCNREQNTSATVQATDERPLEWNNEALHFRRGLPIGNREQSARPTVSVDDLIAPELTYNSFPPLVMPSYNREQNSTATVQATDERPLECNYEALHFRRGLPAGNREQSARPTVSVDGLIAPDPTYNSFPPLVMPSYNREQNAPSTVQATNERPLEWNNEALHFRRGLPTGNREQSARPTVSVDGLIAPEPTYNSFPPLVMPSYNREQNAPATVQATNERPLEWNNEALHFRRGLPTGDREQSARPIAPEPPFNSFPHLVMPRCNWEQNASATVQAVYETPLQNVAFGALLNTSTLSLLLDLSGGFVLYIPMVGAVGAAKSEVVPPSLRTPPDLEPSRLQCRVCLDKDSSMVLIPCGHMICEECEPYIYSCPFCRAIIKNVQKFFL